MIKKREVRTRFAPSPTGFLHIGGARTALFNCLLSNQKNGQFVLRIEDTDIQRNKEYFIEKLYYDLCWLGLKPNESVFQKSNHGPYRQTERLNIYQEYINKLMEKKKAYYCFCSEEELKKEKEEYIKKNQRSNYQYSKKCFNLTKKQVKSLLENEKKHLIRFHVNQERNYKFLDLVRGEIVFKGFDIEDFVICRSSGVPLLNFAVVIDDYLMEISHVLRGEEHLSNTGKQLALYEALDWTPPIFAHLSLILNKEKKKLSKREESGDNEGNYKQFQLIGQLRNLGYLPSAITNYLLFLGWHPGLGANKEFFSVEEAAYIFDLNSLNAKGAVYDLEKLNWYNNHYIQQLTKKEFAEYAWQFLGLKYGLELEKRNWVEKISELFRSQLNYFQELIELTKYFFQRPQIEKTIKNEKMEIFWLEELKKGIDFLEEWELEGIKKMLESVFLNNKISKKEFYLLIRKILTGKDRGPELLHIIYLLNKKEVKERLENFLN